MKIRTFILLIALGMPAWAEDWTTTDGTTHKNVKVLSHDEAFVTILDSDGGAKIPLRTLPLNLQKRFNYDAAKAQQAEATSTQSAAAERKAVLAAQTQAMQRAGQTPPASSPSAVSAIQAGALTPVSPEPAASASNDQGDQLKAVKRQDIQEHIARLEDDIRLMRKEMKKGHNDGHHETFVGQDGEGHRFGQGGYNDKIADDQKQIAELKDELAKL